MPGDDLLGFLLGCGCEARCCCGQSVPAPAARPSGLFQQAGRRQEPPRLPDESPFIPSPVSYDSPQRPGLGHAPEVDAAGTFLASGPAPASALVLDTGELLVTPATQVDHTARVVRWLAPGWVDDNSPPDLSTYGVTSSYAAGELAGDPRVGPVDQSVTVGGLMRRHWTVVTQPYAGGPREEVTVTTTRAYRIGMGRVTSSGDVVLDYRRQVRWTKLTGPNNRWRRTERVIAVFPHGDSYLPEDGSLYITLHTTSVDRTEDQWIALGDPPGEDAPLLGGFPLYETLERGDRLATIITGFQPPEPAPVGPRWQAPGVTVTGSWSDDHARLLPGEVLTAHGQTRAGGSWAGLCGPVGEDGTPAAWVLHEAGGDVSVIRPDGVSTLPREQFEVEILRAPPGTFQRFGTAGPLDHSWPPQWALADGYLAGGVRAVVLHDPWRDSRAGRPPEGSADPAWWWWPGRPGRPPRTLPPSAPTSPLGLALADVYRGRDPDDSGGGS